MCGRARCSLAPEEVVDAARVRSNAPSRWKDRDKYKPSYNVSPGAWLPVIKASDNEGNELQSMRWGLIPSFTKHGDKLDFYRMFNARSETVNEKPAFKRLMASKRCVVLVNGFYEWAKEGSKKQPYYIHVGEGQPMRFAGLYDMYTDESGQQLHSCTILTVDSSPRLQWLHDRMPAVLPDDDAVAAWLGHGTLGEGDAPHDDDASEKDAVKGEGGGPAADEEGGSSKGSSKAGSGKGGSKGGGAGGVDTVKLVHQLCVPYNSPVLTWHPVTPEMSKPAFDSPAACKDMRMAKGTISSFFSKAKPSSPSSPAAAGKSPATAGPVPAASTATAAGKTAHPAKPGTVPAALADANTDADAAGKVTSHPTTGVVGATAGSTGAAVSPSLAPKEPTLNTDEHPAAAAAAAASGPSARQTAGAATAGGKHAAGTAADPAGADDVATTRIRDGAAAAAPSTPPDVAVGEGHSHGHDSEVVDLAAESDGDGEGRDHGGDPDQDAKGSGRKGHQTGKGGSSDKPSSGGNGAHRKRAAEGHGGRGGGGKKRK